MNKSLIPSIRFINSNNGNLLEQAGNYLVEINSKEIIAPIEGGIPRFVSAQDNYSESFGWQWNYWANIRSARSSGFGLNTVIY